MKYISLNDLVKINKGKKHNHVYSKQTTSTRRYIQIDDLRNDNNLKYTDDIGTEVNKDDLIIAWDGANAGTIGYGLEGFIGSTLARLRLNNNDLLTSYLGFFLKSKFQFIRDRTTGATIPHVSKQNLLSIQVPYLDKSEQQELVNKLTKLNLIIQNKTIQIELFDDYLRSKFYEMFGDFETNISHNSFLPLGEISEIASGVTKGQHYFDKFTEEIPYLRVANVQDGHLNLNEIKQIKTTIENINNFLLRPGDILMTEGGDFDKLGRGAIWHGEIDRCIHQNHIFRVRFDQKIINPEFFEMYLKTPFAKKYFLRMSKKTTNLATINMTQLKALPVPLVSLAFQNKFVSMKVVTKNIQRKFRLGQADVSLLFNSLMQKSFNSYN